MKKKILVLQQVAHEGLGRMYSLFRRAGAAEEVVPCYLNTRLPASLDPYSALVILGGPMSVADGHRDDMRVQQIALARQAIETDFPTLGICLGAQIIAAAAGSRIFRGDAPEIGWYDVNLSPESDKDPLFTGLPNPLPVFQWHGEGFDLPGGAVHLASSGRFPHQAFRLRNRVYGLQFHLETEESMVKEWITENADELNSLGDTIDTADMTKDTASRYEHLGAAADIVVTRWLQLVTDNLPT